MSKQELLNNKNMFIQIQNRHSNQSQKENSIAMRKQIDWINGRSPDNNFVTSELRLHLIIPECCIDNRNGAQEILKI